MAKKKKLTKAQLEELARQEEEERQRQEEERLRLEVPCTCKTSAHWSTGAIAIRSQEENAPRHFLTIFRCLQRPMICHFRSVIGR